MATKYVTGGVGSVGNPGLYDSPNGGPGGAGGIGSASLNGATGAVNTASGTGGSGGAGGNGYFKPNTYTPGDYIPPQYVPPSGDKYSDPPTYMPGYTNPGIFIPPSGSFAVAGNAGAGGAGGDGYAYVEANLSSAPSSQTTAIAMGGAGGAAGTAASGGNYYGTGARGGAGGGARAIASGLSTTSSTDPSMRVTASATGGAGGAGSYTANQIYGGGSGGDGGTAYAKATTTGVTAYTNHAYATASAVGGAGGRGYGIGYSGGAGGVATVKSVYAKGDNATSEADQTGGAGGYGTSGANGGAGAGSTLYNMVSAATVSGNIDLIQSATGGAGGGSDGGTAGAGGYALSSLSSGTSASEGDLTGSTTAIGGAGGAGFSNGAGGSAHAYTFLTGDHATTASASAIGGSGNGQGAAQAGAYAWSLGGNGAQSIATTAANGSSGSTHSLATSNARGVVTSIGTGSSGGVYGSNTTTNSRASVGGTVDGFNGIADNAYAFATAAPNSTYVSDQLNAHQAVKNSLGAVGSTVFGTATQGAYHSVTVGGTFDYISQTSWQIDQTNVSGFLVLGLLGSDPLSTGFTSLEFKVVENNGSSATIDNIFNSLSDATTFFGDHALSLGTASGSGFLNVTITLDLLTSTTDSTGFGANYLIGTSQTAPCFLSGTSIRMIYGDRRVEDLREGDRVVTHDGSSRPIVWIGHRRIDVATHPHPDRVLPIRIRRDAFGDGLPQRDLLVSPDHAICTDGVLIAARQLVNGATIVQDASYRSVLYFHVELDRHDVLLAEALPAESYLDTGNRDMFANGPGAASLHPLFDTDAGHPDRQAGACARLALDAETVEPVWRRLNARAAELGHQQAAQAVTTDPGLLLQTDHETLRPAFRQDGSHVFVLRRPSRFVRLLSRSARPADARPWLDDRRALGVRVQGLAFDDGTARCDVPLDHPALAQGWWDTERTADTLARWTNGSATLDLPLGAGLLHVRLAGEMAYPLEGAQVVFIRPAA